MHSDTLPTPLAGLLILGFGGHARSVADVALAAGIRELRFVDSNAREGENFLGFPVLSHWDAALPEGWAAFSAAGDNARREQQIEAIEAAGWPLASVIAPSATLGVDSQIAPGCFIGQQAHVGPVARIARGCIINSGAIVEHESEVGEFSHVAVNACVAGRSRTGRRNFIGAGATVIDGVSLGDDITIGAGGVVTASIESAGVYVGVPARPLG
ncbi:acetyltransferase [Pseudomonas sp. CAN2814]|uniref:acetyltransferase n=1 Tax=Pseudomonas sp. CAN1 TaxID=3046726 RepID=UPI002648E810|nr:acetyltransferase [Pseudomonas sp. CAN1]MDN6857392.1 acetyltransferase [Pseudomonas sp. CAN1]